MRANEPAIICGTDFSEPATQAANVAAAIARRLDAKLLLLHAAEHPGVIAEPPEVGQAFITAQSEELHAAAEALRLLGTEVEEAFAFGPADKALVEVASERKARMIVVAAVGRTRRLLMGSMAVRTAETATVPTLVVRQGGRLAEWVTGKRALRIVMGDDFSATGESALRFVKDLEKLGACDITVVHVDWPPEERRRHDLRGPVSLTENDPEVQRALEEKLAERTHGVLGHRKCTMHVVPCWGRADGYLLSLASETGADLLVLGTHQRHGLERFRLGSVSRAVLNDALVSVAVVPMSKKPAARNKGRVRAKVVAGV
jgi:nucleotide-binding universal stress UspA family protein